MLGERCRNDEAHCVGSRLGAGDPHSGLSTHIAPGESVGLPIGPSDGECATELSWTLATACRTLRVTAQANGRMTVQAIPQDNSNQPLVSVCCVSGNDRGGNPVTLPVIAATDFTVEVGLSGNVASMQSVLVKTSFDP